MDKTLVKSIRSVSMNLVSVLCVGLVLAVPAHSNPAGFISTVGEQVKTNGRCFSGEGDIHLDSLPAETSVIPEVIGLFETANWKHHKKIKQITGVKNGVREYKTVKALPCSMYYKSFKPKSGELSIDGASYLFDEMAEEYVENLKNNFDSSTHNSFASALEAYRKEFENPDRDLAKKISKFTKQNMRRFVSWDEKEKYNAIGQIRTRQANGKTVGVGTAQIVKVEGIETTHTLAVTSAHVINSIKISGKKQFCIGDDTSNSINGDCYNILDIKKGFNQGSHTDPRDWAVLVLEKIVDKVKVEYKESKVKPFLIQQKVSNYKSLAGTHLLNVAYSGDTERYRRKQNEELKTRPTISKKVCSFKRKSAEAQKQTTDAMEIHDCHTEFGSSGSALFDPRIGKNYLVAIQDGSRGKKINHGTPFNDTGLPNSSADHYNRAVKVQGDFHKAILEVAQKYRK